MALEAAFKNLWSKLKMLDTQFTEHLLWVITESKPQHLALHPAQSDQELADHYLAGHYEDEVTELIGLVKEARSSAEVGKPSQPALAIRSLITCQEQLNQIMVQFFSKLASCESIEELVVFGREHSGAWNEWAENVKVELERCHQPLAEVNQALLLCWKEFAERIELTSISTQTNIGLQIKESR